MTKKQLEKLSIQFGTLNVAVLADVFLDKYTYGLVRGTSLETPVPLYEFERRVIAPGAAGNVASNFAALGATVTLIGAIGDDDDSRTLVGALKERKVKTNALVQLKSTPTNSYEKFIARAPNGKSQEVLLMQTRIDENSAMERARTKILANLENVSNLFDAVVVVDQVSHLCNETVFAEVTSLCKKLKVLSVGNSRHQIRWCKDFDLLVVNELEAAQASSETHTTSDHTFLGRILLPQVRQAVLLTAGPDGTWLFEKKSPPVHHPSIAKEIVDITGAGDTALATYVCARLAQVPGMDALFLANAAAAVVILKPGTATASMKEIARLL